MKVGLLQKELWRLHAIIFRSPNGYKVLVNHAEYRIKTLQEVLYLLRVLEKHANN